MAQPQKIYPVINEIIANTQLDKFEYPFRIGDIVTLNSGGPNCLVVDLNKEVTISWRNQKGAVQEWSLPYTSIHRIRLV